MQVSKSNDIKIYNLSAGKSVPQWLSERKRRNLEQKDVEVRRRIQLIQDFEMPSVSNSIAISPDGQYIMAAGNYKPALRCYDVNDMSLKFERGLDSDVIKILPLTEDFSKVAMLEKDRHIEFHARFGHYFRSRIPKYGRDMAHCKESSDLFMVGSGREIYRLNLEQGQFLPSLTTDAESLNCCEFNSQHQLFVCGTSETTVEAWDYRSNQRVGILDCAIDDLNDEATISHQKPSVTSVKFKDALNLSVGTSTGHVLLYDIRSTKPRLVKNHNLGLPINGIEYVPNQNLILSMDERVLKMWNESDGKPFAAIEPGSKLTQFVRYPDSGLLFFAHDAPKMLQYFVPALGPSPKWCYFLDSLTEELEEADQPAVYDDYKFVTKQQLEELGLEQMIGTNTLRAYMHGYFIDFRMYNKAKALNDPFAFEKYKADKLRVKVNEERETRILINKARLPKINRELATKLQADLQIKEGGKSVEKKKKIASELLEDNRFKDLFKNPDFEVDKDSESFHQITERIRKHRVQHADGKDYSEDEDDEAGDSKVDFDAKFGENPDVSSDEEDEVGSVSEHEKEEEPEREKAPPKPERKIQKAQKFKLVGLSSSRDFQSFTPGDEHEIDPAAKTTGTMGQRRKQLNKLNRGVHVEDAPFGGKSATFTLAPDPKEIKKTERQRKVQEHMKERQAVRRTTDSLKRLMKPLGIEKAQKKFRRR